MLFPEKMIDFVRMTGHLLLAAKALHREKIEQRWPKKKQKNIKIKFELQTLNLHQIIQRELMIGL